MEEMERRLKMAEAEKSVLEGQLTETVSQFTEVHDEVGRLRRDLSDKKLELRELYASREEVIRRCDRFAETNRSLVLEMEESKAAAATIEVIN